MRPTPTTRAAATVAAMALLAACSSSDATEDPTEDVSPVATSPSEGDPSGTPATGPSPTPTTTASEGMTIEQAQEIVDATTAVYNDAVTRMLTQQRIDTRWYEQMREIYTDPMVEIIERVWLNAAENQFEDFNTTDPTGIEDKVLEVVDVRSDCLVVHVERNYNGVTAPDAEDAIGVSDIQYIAFNRAEDETRGAGTGWVRNWDIFSRDGTPEDLCERQHDDQVEDGGAP